MVRKELYPAIREATASDVRDLLDLYQLLELEPASSPVLKDAQERFERYRSYPNYRVYVVESVGQIVGTFALIFVESIAHGGKPYGVVEDVVVARDWQGRGIGKMMMADAMWRAQEFGCYKLMLSSHLRRTEAHAFYESLGFGKHGFSFLVT